MFSDSSLAKRFWAVLLLVFAPILILVFHDYYTERQAAIDHIERQARGMMSGLRVRQEGAEAQVRQLLSTMAWANKMHSLNANDCNGLASRLHASVENFSNIGAVLPNGEVFCSSLGGKSAINVLDRNWFQDVQSAQGTTRGQFLTGKMPGRPGITFGFPVRDAVGELVAAVFASTDISWFDELTTYRELPAGWSSVMFSTDGEVISRYPHPPVGHSMVLPESSRELLLDSLAKQKKRVVMIGEDGLEHLFILEPVKLANNSLITSISAPIGSITQEIERAFLWRFGLLMSVFGLSLFLAYRFLFKSLKVWLDNINGTAERVTNGNLEALLVEEKIPDELAILNRRFNIMVRTLQYQVEQTQHSEERYRALFQGSHCVMLIIDPVTGDIVDANKGAENYYGWTQEQLKRMKIAQINTLSAEQLCTEMKRATSQLQDHFRFQHRRADGSVREVESCTGPIHIDDRQLLYTIVHDVTDRVMAEREILKLNMAIEQSPESIVITNLNAEIEYVNDAFLNATGYRRSEVIGQNPRILQSGKTSPEHFVELWQTLTEGRSWRGELLNKRKDGSEYFEFAIITPVIDTRGNISHY